MRSLAMPPCPLIESLPHEPIGVFIAILAAIGIIVPFVMGEKISRGEKTYWMVLMLVLLCAEFYSLYSDQRQHDSEQDNARCEQLHSFSAIAQKLEGDISANKQHFDQTMDKVSGLLESTRTIGNIAEKNLENLTGGESFAYVTPFSTSAPFTTFMLRNDGNQILSGVHVEIEAYTNDCSLSTVGSCIPSYDIKKGIEVGILGARTRQSILEPVPVTTRADRTGHYNIRIVAQNGQAIQEMWFRPSTLHLGFAYRFVVIRPIHRKPRKSDLIIRSEHFDLLKTQDWTEYSPSESKDGKTLFRDVPQSK
jgi:hypothetical protein